MLRRCLPCTRWHGPCCAADAFPHRTEGNRMLRRARLTVLELGASAMAWASCHALGADDWIVVAQQGDEAALEFTQRVRQRALRLRKEGAQLAVVDVYAGPDKDGRCATARREVIQELGGQMATGGRLTL